MTLKENEDNMNILPIELFNSHEETIKSLVKQLVNIESPSTEKQAVDRFGKQMIGELEGLGGEIQEFPQNETGDHIRARWGDGPGGVLLLMHMDTVFESGTLAQRPYREADGKLYGPGVMDMKASIAMFLAVMRFLRQEKIRPERPITALFTSDEEIGSLTSRAIIEAEAKQAEVVLCLEPALSNGNLKTSRKGTGDIEILVKGVASHAGVDHAKGKNAIEELAHHILAAQQLTDYTKGTTANVGIIQGGTRSNVVPDEARCWIDFRVAELAEYERLKQWVSQLKPVIQGTSISATIDLNRPPMPRNERMIHTFQKVQAIGQQLGLSLDEGSTGGGSDGNFVSPLGIPVMDGLGVVGDGAHSEREYAVVGSLVERTALLANLLLNW
jgi:glutamate carboxypeptidase